jgi:NAD(P)-dependent dehydrogenase (short-subunit alcohol dehydrogenase family)
MELRGKVAVVTGAANGIGRACATRFAAEGAKVVVADLDSTHLQSVADEIGALAVATDVSVEADIQHLVARAEQDLGPIDLFHSNAGIGVGGGVDAPDEDWQRIWDVNLMAHVYATRAVLPSMIERGDGYLLSTASAAGLLTNIGNAPYSVTKHAAVALAEWLSVTYGDRGIKVSCLCPQGVATNMLLGGRDAGDAGASVVMAAAGVLQPEEVADVVVQGLRDERFLILPHPEVAEFFLRKASDYDRWLGGMRRLQARVRSQS